MAQQPSTFSNLPYAQAGIQARQAGRARTSKAIKGIGQGLSDLSSSVADKYQDSVRFGQAREGWKTLVKTLDAMKAKDPDKFAKTGLSDPATQIPPPRKGENVEQYLNKVNGAVTTLVSTGLRQGLFTDQEAAQLTGLAPDSLTALKQLGPTRDALAQKAAEKEEAAAKERKAIGRRTAVEDTFQQAAGGPGTGKAIPMPASDQLQQDVSEARAGGQAERMGIQAPPMQPSALGTPEHPASTQEELMGRAAKMPAPIGGPITAKEADQSLAVQSLPPAEKPLTEYQKLYLSAMRQRNATADQMKFGSEFFKESEALWGNSKDYEGLIQSAEDRLRNLDERAHTLQEQTDKKRQRIEEEITKLNETIKDVYAEPQAQEAARGRIDKLNSDLEKADKELQKELDRIPNERETIQNRLIDYRDKSRVATRAWEMYMDAQGRLTYGQAQKRAMQDIQGAGGSQPIGGRPDTPTGAQSGTGAEGAAPQPSPASAQSPAPQPIGPPAAAAAAPAAPQNDARASAERQNHPDWSAEKLAKFVSAEADSARTRLRGNHKDWPAEKIDRYLERLIDTGKL